MNAKMALILSLIVGLAHAESRESDKIKGFLDIASGRSADADYLKTYLYRTEQQALTLSEKIELAKKFLAYAQANTDKWENGATSPSTFLSIIGGGAVAGMFLGTLIGAAANKPHSAGAGLLGGTVIGSFMGLLGAAIYAADCYGKLHLAYRNEAIIAKRLSQLQQTEQLSSTLLVR